MLSWFPIGKIIRITVLSGLAIAVFMVARSNVDKLGALFTDGSATSAASVREVGQALEGIKSLIDNSGLFNRSDVESEDDEDGYDEDGSSMTLDERLDAVRELMGNSSIYPQDGGRPSKKARRNRQG